MDRQQKNLGKWTLSFLSILIGSFIIFIAIPLFWGFPVKYLPILIGVGGIVIALLHKKFLK